MIHLLWNKFISEHGCVHQRSGLCSPPSSCGSELSKTCPLVYFCFTLTYCVKDYHIMSNIRVDYPVCLHFRWSKGLLKSAQPTQLFVTKQNQFLDPSSPRPLLHSFIWPFSPMINGPMGLMQYVTVLNWRPVILIRNIGDISRQYLHDCGYEKSANREKIRNSR